MKVIAVSSLFLASVGAVPAAISAGDAQGTTWRVAGEIVEACTCQVPCTCQFGQGPSPTPHCASVSTFAVEEGSSGGTSLAGGKFAIVFGPKKTVLYAGGRDAAQRAALRVVLGEIAKKSGWKSAVIREADIAQSVEPGGMKTSIGSIASMEAGILTGFDGKTPIAVENNNDFNVPRIEKGKTVNLKYSDDLGNSIEAKDSNAGRGRFDWTDQTPQYFH